MRTRLPRLKARSDNELPFTLPKFYPITDARISRMSHAEQVERLAKGGATFVQLREKHASPRDFYAAALEAVQVALRLGVRVIINDRVDIAMAVGADGVHLGQDDLPPEKARALLGKDRIIGFSTHDLKQAMAASFTSVDYVALGPVFQTSTKEKPDPVVGLAGISEVRESISKPLVAIGGITFERAKSVIEAGADSVAVISDLYSTEDVAERARRFIRLLG